MEKRIVTNQSIIFSLKIAFFCLLATSCCSTNTIPIVDIEDTDIGCDNIGFFLKGNPNAGSYTGIVIQNRPKSNVTEVYHCFKGAVFGYQEYRNKQLIARTAYSQEGEKSNEVTYSLDGSVVACFHYYKGIPCGTWVSTLRKNNTIFKEIISFTKPTALKWILTKYDKHKNIFIKIAEGYVKVMLDGKHINLFDKQNVLVKRYYTGFDQSRVMVPNGSLFLEIKSPLPIY